MTAGGDYIAIDKYPQWLNLTGIAANGETYAESETTLPIRISDRQVMEVLAVEFDHQQDPFASPATTDPDTQQKHSLQITTRSKTVILGINEPDLIDKSIVNQESQYSEVTEAGGAGMSSENVVLHDFAGSGKGFLVASQSLFLGIDTTTAANSRTSDARILYRLVKVTAEELIGLVQQ